MMLEDAFTSNALEQIKRYSQIAQDLNSTPQHHPPAPAHHLPHHHHPSASAAAAAALPLGPPPLQALAPSATAAAAAAAVSAAPTTPQLASALLARLDAFEVRVNAHDYNVVRRQRLAEMSSEVQAVQHQLEADLLLATDGVLQQQEAQDTVAKVRARLHQATEDKHEGLRDVTAHFRDGSAAFLGALEVCGGGGVDGSGGEPTLAVFEAEVRRIEASMDAVKVRQEESVQVMQAELWRLHKAVEETREGRKASEAEFMKLVEVVVGKLTAELKEEKEKRVALFRTLRAELKRRNIAGRIRGGGGVASALAASAGAAGPQGSRRSRHQQRGVSPPRHARARQPQRRDVSPPAPPCDEEQASPTPATLRLPPASIFTHLFQTPQPAQPPPAAAAPSGERGSHGLARARPLSQLSQNTLATAPRGSLKGWKPSESVGQQQSRRPSVGVRVDARDAADKPKWK
eukprot:Rhum_TRINITY_DN14630_c12_g1::Rhum_TRINITY_DN14630_c12_g1_i1::g.105397::m.105397